MIPSKRAGFTLLEMLVVLILVSLISVLMMQGFSFVVGLHERIRHQLIMLQDIELREQWFRSVVRAMHIGRSSDNAAFKGDAFSFSGLTLQPLDGLLGMPTNIHWRIERTNAVSVLTYQQGDDTPVSVFEWSLTSPEFRYLDAQGQLQSSWPPGASSGLPFDLFTNGDQKLPKGVAIIDANENTDFLWYVAISHSAPAEVDYAL